MGKSITPTYTVRMSYVHFTNRRREVFEFAYDYKRHGKPSEVVAKDIRKVYNASLQQGGVNHHLREGQSDYGTTQIVVNSTKEVVAEYKPPMFEVID